MLSLLILLFTFSPIQQVSPDTSTVESTVQNVTVFRSQAQIERTAQVQLEAGKNIVVFTELSPSMITNSIQFKGKGAFTLLSITNRNDFFESKSTNSMVTKLIAKRDSLQREISSIRAKINVINSSVSLLSSSANIANNHKLTAVELNALLDLNSKRLLEFEEQKIELNKRTQDLNAEIRLVNNRIREFGSTTRTRFKEVVAEIEMESARNMEFSLQYLVNNAGWNPSYDIRSEGVSEPLSISYKAKIYQNTGYDWNDVNFTINSGDPSQNIQKPKLSPKFASFYVPLPPSVEESKAFKDEVVATESSGNPGAAFKVQIRGNNSVNAVSEPIYIIDGIEIDLGTNGGGANTNPLNQIDPDDIESMEVLKDAEAVALYGERAATGVVIITTKSKLGRTLENEFISNQTSFSYKIERPYSVPSDGKEHLLDIKSETPETNYMYATVPKLSTNAFLIGTLSSWNDLNLIEGDANVYFENSFIGNTYLDPSSLRDSLEISLGKDERIIVERKKLKDFEERRFFGSRTRESLSYEISIRNTKSESIEIIVEDQIPLSTDEDIKVTDKELTGGSLNKQTGIITWRLKLAPNETKKLKMNFEIEYPKGKRISY